MHTPVHEYIFLRGMRLEYLFDNLNFSTIYIHFKPSTKSVDNTVRKPLFLEEIPPFTDQIITLPNN